MADAVLELSRIEKSFGALQILKGVDLVLPAGGSAAVIGPSGSGKSTLLHIAGLMDRASSGAVRLGGQDTGALSEDARARHRLDSIGFLFQFHYLLPDFDVIENVLMPARLAGDDMAAAHRRAKELLARLGLAERENQRPYQLSGGEQQRAGLARAILRRPKLLLCDEPTGNLDQRTADEVSDIIWDELKREGVAALIVTHNQRLASRANAVHYLDKGSFVETAKGYTI